eukprot:Opistho-2@31681
MAGNENDARHTPSVHYGVINKRKEAGMLDQLQLTKADNVRFVIVKRIESTAGLLYYFPTDIGNASFIAASVLPNPDKAIERITAQAAAKKTKAHAGVLRLDEWYIDSVQGRSDTFKLRHRMNGAKKFIFTTVTVTDDAFGILPAPDSPALEQGVYSQFNHACDLQSIIQLAATDVGGANRLMRHTSEGAMTRKRQQSGNIEAARLAISRVKSEEFGSPKTKDRSEAMRVASLHAQELEAMKHWRVVNHALQNSSPTVGTLDFAIFHLLTTYPFAANIIHMIAKCGLSRCLGLLELCPKIDYNLRDENGRVASDVARENGHKDLADELDRRCVCANCLHCESPAHKAIQDEHIDCFLALVRLGRVCGFDQQTPPIIVAVKACKMQILPELLRSGFDASACDQVRRTALHYAAERNTPANIEAMEILLHHLKMYRDDIGLREVAEMRDALGDTPAHVAARATNAEALRILLAHGIRVDVQNAENITPGDLLAEAAGDATEVRMMKSLCRQVVENHLFAKIEASALHLEKTKIGEGNFGTVRKGILSLADGSTVAIAAKFLKAGEEAEARTKTLELIREYETMCRKNLRHVNVVLCHGLADCGPEGLALVLELATEGSLEDWLRSHKFEDGTPQDQYSDRGRRIQTIRSEVLHSIGFQVASGMAFLASRALTHRDLAVRNIMVTLEPVAFVRERGWASLHGMPHSKSILEKLLDKTQESENGDLPLVATVKIGDFGLARSLDKNGLYQQKTVTTLPLPQRAPESFAVEAYSCFSDVWAYGVLLYELWTLGGSVMRGYDIKTWTEIEALLRQGRRLPQPKNCPSTVYNIMRRCFRFQDAARPSFTLLSGLLCDAAGQALAAVKDPSGTLPRDAYSSESALRLLSLYHESYLQHVRYDMDLRQVSAPWVVAVLPVPTNKMEAWSIANYADWSYGVYPICQSLFESPHVVPKAIAVFNVEPRAVGAPTSSQQQMPSWLTSMRPHLQLGLATLAVANVVNTVEEILDVDCYGLDPTPPVPTRTPEWSVTHAIHISAALLAISTGFHTAYRIRKTCDKLPYDHRTSEFAQELRDSRTAKGAKAWWTQCQPSPADWEMRRLGTQRICLCPTHKKTLLSLHLVPEDDAPTLYAANKSQAPGLHVGAMRGRAQSAARMIGKPRTLSAAAAGDGEQKDDPYAAPQDGSSAVQLELDRAAYSHA